MISIKIAFTTRFHVFDLRLTFNDHHKPKTVFSMHQIELTLHLYQHPELCQNFKDNEVLQPFFKSIYDNSDYNVF